MTGQDFQDRLDALVVDLQTTGKGQTVNLMFRNPNNSPNILPLSSDVAGIVNAAQLAAVQAFVDGLKPIADSANTTSAPVTAASDAFKAARTPHEPAITAAQTAQTTLRTTLEADVPYQTAKATLEAARTDVAYISSQSDYKNFNVSENYAAIQQARGEYVV